MASAPTIGAIETEYAGVRFRSRTEARWAVFFDALGIEWMHEPEAYSNGRITYLPDFWLPQLEMFWEVKPNDRYDRAKPEMLAELTRCNVVVSTADPWTIRYWNDGIEVEHFIGLPWREEDELATELKRLDLIASGAPSDEIEWMHPEVADTFSVVCLDRVSAADLGIAIGDERRQLHFIKNALGLAAKWRFWTPGSPVQTRCGALTRPDFSAAPQAVMTGVYDDRHDRLAGEWMATLPGFHKRRIKSVCGRKGAILVDFLGGAPDWFSIHVDGNEWPTGDGDFFHVSA